MAAAELGKISVTPGGSWSAGVKYDTLTMVRDKGAVYLSKAPVPLGTPPDSEQFWMLLTRDGIGGTVDTQMSDTSRNPVENKVIKKYVDEHSGGSVDSVNGKTGIVSLNAADVGAVANPGGGAAGQFAVSNGAGGIAWKTIPDAEGGSF